MNEIRRIAIRTGVTLNVALAGEPQKPPVILLHGFPESHRTWRALAPLLHNEFFLVMPDQRGFGRSDLPQDVAAYRSDILIDDLFALADALDLDRFALVGHDWGGAIAWGASLRQDARLSRLAIVNSPHPAIFQKSLVENDEQRLASQYISAFRREGFERMVEEKGFDWFFDTTFARHVDVSTMPSSERRQYIAEWSRAGAFNAMLNWYRASQVVVPPPGATLALPDWLSSHFPRVKVPTLVIWGMDDRALLPVQLEGLDAFVDELRVIQLHGVGHFAPWEAPEALVLALEPFLAGRADASATAS